ncbi:hypothetical protein D9M70_611990 [compost metagenome]
MPQYLSIAAVGTSNLPCRCSSRQRSTKTRPTWISVAISASLKRVFWNSAMDLPNALRSRVKSRVQFNAASAEARAPTPTVKRSWGSSCIR